MLSYTLTRSQRNFAVIYVRNASVEVRAPLSMPKWEIDSFVLSKERWILKSIAKQQARAESRNAFVVDYGSMIFWRGKECLIVRKDGAKARFDFDNEAFFMPPGLSAEQIKATCVNLYRRLAKVRFTQRASFFAGLMGVAPSAVKVTGAKTRWGSCSSKKSINFSWRLIMADDGIIDYVVVHELAHLFEMNHSSRFCRIVAGVLPDYKERETKLKALQRRLVNENWE